MSFYHKIYDHQASEPVAVSIYVLRSERDIVIYLCTKTYSTEKCL